MVDTSIVAVNDVGLPILILVRLAYSHWISILYFHLKLWFYSGCCSNLCLVHWILVLVQAFSVDVIMV